MKHQIHVITMDSINSYVLITSILHKAFPGITKKILEFRCNRCLQCRSNTISVKAAFIFITCKIPKRKRISNKITSNIVS